jgi:3D-(3,5/4)-trihydroxycyclohexane-1,2-dione acylhydrolase (decyclizing)
MGFAVSALLASAAADHPQYTIAFTGDGSLTMNMQILFDGIEHGAKGLIIVFDNRSMAAIGNLQEDQYTREYKVSDSIRTDYVKLASSIDGLNALSGGSDPDSFKKALDRAIAYDGLSLIHLPVYYGRDELGGLGVYGSWNVGPWCTRVQREHHSIGL